MGVGLLKDGETHLDEARLIYTMPSAIRLWYCTVIGATQSGATARAEDGNE